jgi:hypothetical protein
VSYVCSFGYGEVDMIAVPSALRTQSKRCEGVGVSFAYSLKIMENIAAP